MTITINRSNIANVYHGNTRIKRIYKKGVMVFGPKRYSKTQTFTASGSFVLPDLISIKITLVAGGGASGGWSNDRHGLKTPGVGGQGGKTIHYLSDASSFSGKTCSFTIGAGGQPGAQDQWGKFCHFAVSNPGGDSSVPLFGLNATGGRRGFIDNNPTGDDGQNGVGYGGNQYNGYSADAYPSLGSGGILNTAAVATPGIAGKGGFMTIEYDYWE